MKRENQTSKLETLQIDQNKKRKLLSKIFIGSVRRLNPKQGRDAQMNRKLKLKPLTLTLILTVPVDFLPI
jgi:hypothetical protein